MITSLLLVSLVASADKSAAPAVERTHFELAQCAESSSVRTTWLAERRADVHTTSNGVPMPTYPTHEERRIDRTITVLECRSGLPYRLRVRYGDAFDKRLDQDPVRSELAISTPDAPAYTTERSSIAGRTFEIVQVGEGAGVFIDQNSPATPSLSGLVLESESVIGGAVPLPGDSVARALAGNERTKGAAFEFDASVAQSLLGGDETAACVATATFLGNERTPEGRTFARFDLLIRVHEEPEGGLVRDADLRGFLLADPRTGRPIHFDVSGSERRLGAAGDAQNATEIEMNGTWRVQRTWDWMR